MINQKFKENWLKILKFNSNLQILDEVRLKEEVVQIPLTPIKINAYLLHSLIEILYPEFISDQQNILDIIISDDGKEIIYVNFYHTKKPGICDTIEKLPNGLFDIKKLHLANLSKLFDEIQSILMENKNIRISSLRIVKQKAIEYLNQYINIIENKPFFDFFSHFLDFFQSILQEDLFYIYPIPNFFNFFKNSSQFIKSIKFSNLFQIFLEIFPNFNKSFIFDMNSLRFITEITNNKKEIEIKINNLETIYNKMDYQQIPIHLEKIREKIKSNYLYLFNLFNITPILSDIFEIEFPLKLDKLELILQKLLFGYRNFEILWYMNPRPKVYNTLRRFLIRLLGFNLNLKKVSHWTIPELLFTYLKSYFGLASKIVIIITDVGKNIKEFSKNRNILKSSFRSAFLIELECEEIKRIVPLSIGTIFSDSETTNNETIRLTLSKGENYVTNVINIDISILKEFFSSFSSQISKFKPYKNAKILKILKNQFYFNMNPILPPFKTFRSLSNKVLVKTIIPLLIDKHEF